MADRHETPSSAGALSWSAAKGKVREYFTRSSLQLRLVARNRHVTIRTTIFDLRACFGMIDVFASNAGLPIRITRGICHDARAPRETYRNIVARRSLQSVVAGQATVRSVECRLKLFMAGGPQHRHDRCQEQRERDRQMCVRSSHYQPSFSFPSCQSQST